MMKQFFEFAMQPDLNLNTHDSEGAWPILIDEVSYAISTDQFANGSKMEGC